MNWETVKGKWTQLKGGARKQWGKLTNDDAEMVLGEREKLLGGVQERYGLARDRAERAADAWIASVVVEKTPQQR